MNAPNHTEQRAPATVDLPPITDSAALILQGDAMDRIERFAKMMASGKLAVPRHFSGQPGDCFAVCLQAMQWRMNPFAVAQKTFVSPSGALGYEGTLVAAALSTSGALEGDLRYEYIGDWSKVRGKFEKRESQNRGNNSSEPKFYIVPTYTRQDEEGLGVRAIGRLRGEREDRVVELFMSQCYPRFSTQWANNPEQQIIYAVDRVWARRHKPSVMLGVYTEDELGRGGEVPEKDMGPAEVVGAPPPPPPPAKKGYPQSEFDADKAAWQKAVNKGKTPKDIFEAIALRRPEYVLSEEQKAVVNSLKKEVVENGASAPTDVTPKGEGLGEKAVMSAIDAAANVEALAEAGNQIGLVADTEARKRLQQRYDEREAELQQGSN